MGNAAWPGELLLGVPWGVVGWAGGQPPTQCQGLGKKGGGIPHGQDFQQISPGFLLLACISKQTKGEKS